MLIKNIRTSLTAKIFLSTTFLLLLVCLLSVFSMARYIPQTYSERLSADLQKQARDFIPTLEKAESLEACYSLVDQFAMRTRATVWIKDENGKILYPDENVETTWQQDTIVTMQDTESGTVTGDLLLAEDDYVFTLSGNEYTFCVQGDCMYVSQAREAIWQTIPVIIAGILVVAVVFSIVYSRYITKPIVALSHTSEKMAQLDFERVESTERQDEIGILSNNLNTLSDNLQRTLSELKKSNAELKIEIEKERELEQRQQEFFSAASHELKTPLTILKGHLMGMLGKIKGYENQELYMARSLAVVEKMEMLVKELLYVSKTERQQKVDYRKTDLAELLRIQIAEMMDLISEKNLNLEADIPDRLLCEIVPEQMERAIQNILINAIRYSPDGETISMSLSEEKNMVSYEVENTGIHIPEDKISHLFEAFYRADTSRNRDTGGTGLGLYIVGKIMELHHADYSIRNSDRGVVFRFEIPSKK